MSRIPTEDAGSVWLVRLGSIAACLGGFAWATKGVVILLTGRQPPAAFEVGPPLFAVALLGLSAALGASDRRARAGAVVAGMAIALMLIGAVARALDPGLAPEGQEFTPLSAVMLATSACLVAALVLLGLASRRSRRLRWSALPFWMGVLVVPGLMLGGALAELDERLLEIPLVAFALGWIAVGYSMWQSTRPITAEAEQERQGPSASAAIWMEPVRSVIARSKRSGTSGHRTAAAAIAGGALWAALAVPARLEAAGSLSYDSFNRFLAPPILLLLVGLIGVHRALAPAGRLARTGSAILVFGFVLMLLGNIVEFWGALLFDKVNADAAHQAGASEHWIGSDIGWMLFGPGMLISVAGGVLLAPALRRMELPPALKVFVGLIGVGILAANLFGLGPALVSVPVFVLYGIGWIALGRHVLLHGLLPHGAGSARGRAPSV